MTRRIIVAAFAAALVVGAAGAGAVRAGTVLTPVAAIQSVAGSAAVTSTVAATVPADEPAPAPALRIMPLGDSITLGLGSMSYSSYRADLYRRLTGAGLNVDFVGSTRHGNGSDTDHEGHSGWTIAQLGAKIDDWLMTYEPDVVLLQIGTNDMRSDARAFGAADRLYDLVTNIRAVRPAAEVFVSLIPGAKAAADQKRIDVYNRRIPGIVASSGSHVHLVDQRSVDGLSLSDNFHPNDFGYAKMAWNLYRAVEPVLRTGAKWPTGVNPYVARQAYLCFVTNGVRDCRWWYARTLARGKAAVWQTQRHVRGILRWVAY